MKRGANMMLTRRFIGLASLFAAVGCTANSERGALNSRQMSVFDTRLYTGDCIVQFPNEPTREAGALVTLGAALVPGLISNSLDALAGYLEELGKDKTFTASAFKNFEIGRTLSWQCLQLIRGNFFLKAEHDVGEYTPEGLEHGERDRFRNSKFRLAQNPDFFAEGRILLSADGSAWTVLPTYLEYNNSVQGTSEPRGYRDIALAVSFHPPGVPATDSSKAVSAVIGFAQLPLGTHRKYPLPAVSPEKSGDRWGDLAEQNGVVSTPWAPIFSLGGPAADRTLPAPMTVTVTVTEVLEGSKLAAFFAGVLRSSKDKLQPELEKLLIAEKRDQAKLVQIEDQINKNNDYYQALGDMKLAEIAYCSAPRENTPAGKEARLKAAQTLAGAQSKAQLAAARIGVSNPVLKKVPIGTSDPDKTICGS